MDSKTSGISEGTSCQGGHLGFFLEQLVVPNSGRESDLRFGHLDWKKSHFIQEVFVGGTHVPSKCILRILFAHDTFFMCFIFLLESIYLFLREC